MKRVAESQLTKDANDNEDESPEMGSGFTKADPSVLGARKIRGLPRRSLVPTSTATSDLDFPVPTTSPSNGKPAAGQFPEPASRFGSFAGFGGAGGVPPEFSFSLPSSQTNGTPSQSTAPPAPLFPSASASPAFFNPSNPTPPSTPPLTPDSQDKQDTALKYYMSLRGINASFLDAVTKAIQTDPFVDVVEMSEKYKSLRRAVQQEFEGHSKVLETSGTAKTPITPQGISSKIATLTPASTTTGIGANFGVGGMFGSTASGFVPKMESSSGTGASPFVWSKPSGSISANDKPASKPSSFTLGKSTPTLAEQTSTESPSLLSGTAVETPDPKPAVTSQPTSGNDKSSVKTDPSDPSFFSFKPTSSAPLTPGFSSFLSSSKPSVATGETSTPPPSKFGSSGASPPSPSTFGFGSGKNLGASSAFGSLGKGNIGNPVGFGFGGPSLAPSSVDTAGSSGTPASTETAAKADGFQADNTSSSLSNTEHDPSPAPSQGSAYDADGPGEEEESTLHETRARGYRLIPTGEKKGWISVGTGQLKLKGHNELTKRRILMRNSSTGQVILNFNLLPAFQVTVDKKTISFRVPGEDESAAVYRLSVSSEKDALKWQETIRHEVDNLVPSSDT